MSLVESSSSAPLSAKLNEKFRLIEELESALMGLVEIQNEENMNVSLLTIQSIKTKAGPSLDKIKEDIDKKYAELREIAVAMARLRDIIEPLYDEVKEMLEPKST